MRDFTKIVAWQLADDLTVAIYEGSRTFPREEIYGLTSQLRRAAYSTPANIAEGASRSTHRDYLNFLYIARGSCSETQYFIHLAHRLKYMDETTHSLLRDQAGEVARTLGGLIRAVEKETGPITRTVARVSSFFVLLGSASLARLGLLSPI